MKHNGTRTTAEKTVCTDSTPEHPSHTYASKGGFSNGNPPVVLISGPLHSGKTSLAIRVLQRLYKNGYRVAGILAPGSWKEGIRNEFNLQVIHTGKTYFLAGRHSLESPHTPGKSPDTVPFRFDESALAAGRDALHPDKCRNAHVIFIDEIGKLELRGLGWAPCLKPLLELPGRLHVWIVRESLVERVCNTWNIHPLLVVNAAESAAEETVMDMIRRSL